MPEFVWMKLCCLFGKKQPSELWLTASFFPDVLAVPAQPIVEGKLQDGNKASGAGTSSAYIFLHSQRLLNFSSVWLSLRNA